MRALLINPWIHDFAAYDLWLKPYGLLQIASSLKKLNVDIKLVDCLDRFDPRLTRSLKNKRLKTTPYGSGLFFSQPIEKPAVFKDVPRRFKRYGIPVQLFQDIIKKEKSPDVILVTSGMTYWYPGVFEAIRILRERFGSTPIILGGIYARLCFGHARKLSLADEVYRGNNINEVVKLVSKVTSTKLEWPEVFDQKPVFPAFELYPKLNYIVLRISKGCPFRCSYCGRHLLEEDFTQAQPQAVIDHIEYYYKKGVRNFSFYDDALLYNFPEHLGIILEELLHRDIRAFFHTPNGLHIRFITAQAAMLLKKAGFIQPRLGLETAESKRQELSGGKANNADFLNAISLLLKAGFDPKDIGVNILMGLPGQDEAEVRDSIKFAASFGCRVCLEEYSPVPGTRDYSLSGLNEEADPLLHNNCAFPIYRGKYHKFQELKDLAHSLNC